MCTHCRKISQTWKALWLIILLVLAFGVLQNSGSAAAAEPVPLPPQSVAPGEASLTVDLKLPAGHKLNQEAPSTISLQSGDKKILTLDEKYTKNLPVANLPLCLTVPVKEGQTSLQTTYRLNFCDEKMGICFFKEGVLTLPVEVSKTAKSKKLEVSHTVKP